MSNHSKKHPKTTFEGLLGPLTVLAEPLFDVETATLNPHIFATLPDGHAVELDDVLFGRSCMECEAAAGAREDYPMGNPEEYRQEMPGSLLFGLKAGDTIMASVEQDSDSRQNWYAAFVVWRLADGKATRTQGPDKHELPATVFSTQ